MATQKEDKLVRGSDLTTIGSQIKTKLAEKQERLVSGVNIKTINSNSIIGPGDISIADGEDGKSAYQIWLDAGNTGTIADYLESLKGDTGVVIDEQTFMGTIVNDKTTGGANKAWSAQMGKQISAEVDNLSMSVTPIVSSMTQNESVDIASVGFRNYYIDSATGKYTTVNTYKHSICPVEYGQIVRVMANSTNGANISFFRSDAAPVSGGTPDYSDEYASIYRVGIAAGSYKDFIVPSDAKYLYFYRGAASADYPYTPESIVISKSAFDKDLVLDEADSSNIANVGVVADAVFDSSQYSADTIDLESIIKEDLCINASANFAAGSHCNIPVSGGDIVRVVGGSVNCIAAMLPCVYGPNSGSSSGASKLLEVRAGKEQWFKVPDGSIAFLFNISVGETSVIPSAITVYRDKNNNIGRNIPVYPAHRFTITSGVLEYIAYTSYRAFVFPVKKYHIYNIYPTTNGNPMKRGFMTTLPRIGAEVTEYINYNSGAKEGMSWQFTAPNDGYFFVNTYKSSSPTLSLQVYDISTDVEDKIDLVSEEGHAMRNEEIATSEDLIKSLQFEEINFAAMPMRNYYLMNENAAYNTYTTYKHCLVPVTEGQYVHVIMASNGGSLAWFTSNEASVSGGVPPYLNGTRVWYLAANADNTYRVPAGAKYMYIYAGGSGYPYLPKYFGLSVNAEAQPEIVKRNDYVMTRHLLGELKSRTRSQLDSETANVPLTLLHYSDIHGMKACQNRINEYRTFWSKYIDDTIQTGDLMADRFTDDYPWGDSSDPDNPNRDILCVIGNHDTATGTGESRIWHDKQGLESYNKFIAPYVANWNVTQPANASENGYCFYYKDYPDSHIRLVVIDAWNTDTDYNAVQMSWFAETLASAKAGDLSVIIASHFRIKAESLLKTPFTKPNVEVANPDSSTFNDPYIPVVRDFIAGGGKFVCWITGHSHYDAISKTSAANGSQINICIANASRQGSDNTLKITNNMISVVDDDPKTFDLFNVMTVDTTYHIIVLLRVGANYDKLGRKVETTCIDYQTGEIVYP